MEQHYNEKIKYFDSKARKNGINTSEKQGIERILRSTNISKGDNILEIGCGTGDLFPIIQDIAENVKITGMDMSPEMLKKARTRNISNVELVKGFCEEMPFEKNSFNIILSFNMFPHIEDKDKALGEISRVLKKEGAYYILHSHCRSKVNRIHRNKGKPVSEDKLPSPKILTELLNQCNFKINQYESEPNHFFLEAKKI